MPQPKQIVQVDDYMTRSFAVYPDGQEPYDAATDSLPAKLWSVVNAELGPNAADVLSHKLSRAVQDHIVKAGIRQ
jgi:hypothetical protein